MEQKLKTCVNAQQHLLGKGKFGYCTVNWAKREIELKRLRTIAFSNRIWVPNLWYAGAFQEVRGKMKACYFIKRQNQTKNSMLCISELLVISGTVTV